MTDRLNSSNNLKYDYATSAGNKIVYILYPMPIPHNIIEDMARKYCANIVVITGMDWDDDLTPWKASGVPSGTPDFKGDAKIFLNMLQESIIPHIENSFNINIEERDIIGVSLSGLFTLWQWMLCDTFRNIVTLSGSFWYKGFTDWLSDNSVHKTGRAYLLLGDLESRTKVPQFKSIDEDTRKVIEILKSKDIDTTFQSVPGNHYQHPMDRLVKGLDFLLHVKI